MTARRDRALLVVIVVIALVALVLSRLANLLPHLAWDLEITTAFQMVHSPAMLAVMKWVCYVFEGWRSVILVLAVCGLFWWRLGRTEALLMLAAAVSSLFQYPVKEMVARPRPLAELVHVYAVETGFGFPSGHAFFSSVFLGLAVYLFFTRLKNGLGRNLAAAGLVLLMLFIGAARIYLGVHWTSDVIGGYLYGSLFLCIIIYLDRRYILTRNGSN